MRGKVYITFLILFLFSCSENSDNDVAVSDLEKRLADFNNQINSINLDISRLDSTINNELRTLKLLSDSTFKLAINYSEIKKDEKLVKEEKINFINPEKLFEEKYNISSLSVLTCTLRDVDKNQIIRYYKGDLIEIFNGELVEQYSIIEINKLNRFIKVKSINYNKEFIVYMDIDQNKNGGE